MESNTTTRIDYIDAMRGLAIILVLQSHVSGFCLNIGDYTPNYHFVSGVPVFFFISGFFSKQIHNKSLKELCYFLYDKAIILLISATIFMAFRAYITDISFTNAITRDGKFGYWFTYALFEFILINVLCQLTFKYIRRIKRLIWLEDITLITIALFMYSLTIPAVRDYLSINENLYKCAGIGYWKNFLYFVLGIIVKQHFKHIEFFLTSRFVSSIIISSFVLLTVYNQFMIQNIWTLFRFIFPLLWLATCFIYFYNYHYVFTNDTFIGKCFQLVGRRTLDIYYLHYLFLPTNLSNQMYIFHDCPIPIIEYAITTLIVVVIICFCLVVSSIIRLSPFLAHYLFGAKISSIKK